MKNREIEDWIGQVSVEKYLMTPTKAKQLLDINTKNRKASPKVVSLYARDMLARMFIFNGHSICVSETGVLLDGQQRLMACEKSGEPFWTILVKELPDEVMLTIDSGKKRTFGDQLKINGHVNYNRLAASTKMLALIAKKDPKDHGWTVNELDAILNKHPNLAESVSHSIGAFHKSDNILAAMHYVGTQTGYEQEANEFIRTWRDGQNNYEYDPVVFIRNKLIRNDMRSDKYTTITRMRYIMLSWHKFRVGAEMKQASLPKDGFYMEDWDLKKCGLA